MLCLIEPEQITAMCPVLCLIEPVILQGLQRRVLPDRARVCGVRGGHVSRGGDEPAERGGTGQRVYGVPLLRGRDDVSGGCLPAGPRDAVPALPDGVQCGPVHFEGVHGGERHDLLRLCLELPGRFKAVRAGHLLWRADF